jgi:hypothetical protein
MKAHSSTHLTSSWSLRAALAAAFLASTACGGDDSTPTPATDSGTDVTTTTPVDSGSDSTTTPDTGTADSTTPDTGADAGHPDTGVPDAGVPDASDGGGEAGPLSFAKDIYPIVGAHCSTCHGVGTIAPPADAGPDATPTSGNGFNFGHLDMGDASAAWASLVGDGGVPAQGIGPVPAQDAGATCATLGSAGLLRVALDDAGGSLFANKVAAKEDGGPTVFCGNPMPNPPTALPLDPGQVQTISDWITQGAKP